MGFITCWNHNVSLINYFSVHLCLSTKIYNKILGLSLTLLNVYRPYEGKQTYQEDLFYFECFKVDNIIIGRYLNLSLNMLENQLSLMSTLEETLKKRREALKSDDDVSTLISLEEP